MRADSFFTNLTKRQSMLLLTAVTFGGAEGPLAFAHLPDDEAEVLKERAERLMAVPREKRIPFLVQEIKRLVMGRKGGDLRGADPRQVVEALRGERPALAEVILRALPAQLADLVRDELPPWAAKPGRALRPEILQVIRWHFERQLQRLQPRQASFLFQDLLNLTAKDLLTLADHLGADEVGSALAALEPKDREEMLKRFSAEQRALASRSSSSQGPRKLEAEGAQQVLAELAGEDPRHTVRRAGLRTLVRACLADSPEFASKLAERHRDELGRMLISSIRTERAAGRHRNAERLKVEVVSRLEQLAEHGLVERPVRLSPPRSSLRNRVATDPPQAEKPAPPVESLPVPNPAAMRKPAAQPNPYAKPHPSNPSGLSSQPSPRPNPHTGSRFEHLRRSPPRPAEPIPEGHRETSSSLPGSREPHRSKIQRDPSGSALHRAPVRSAPGEVPRFTASGQPPERRTGEISRSAQRPRVVRGDAAEKARPARPRGRSNPDDER